MLEQYWDNLYPRLDPDDNNDPTERMNILANLASQGEPYRFIPRLKETSVAQSPSLGRVKLNDILVARQGTGAAAQGQPPSLSDSQIQGIFKDTNPDALKAVYDAVVQSADHIKAIDTFLNGKVGTRGANLDELSQCVKQLQTAIAPHVVGAVPAGGEVAGAGAEVVAGGGAPRPVASVPGAINSRDDVVRTLDRVCDYYDKNEPSSPVPLLLRRAQRIAKMTFLEIVKDLTPDAMDRLKVVAGKQPED
jgi:type VI secretion system protein ImpA